MAEPIRGCSRAATASARWRPGGRDRPDRRGELPAAQSVADPIGQRFPYASLRDALTLVFVDPDA